MATSSLSLLKSTLRTSLAEALYNEIVANSNNYYYFIGKTLEWDSNLDVVLAPEPTGVYENSTREDMVFLKKITSADVSFVTPRHNWEYNRVYDMYDDYLGGTIVVPNCTGSGVFILGTFNPAQIGVGYMVTGSGISVGTRVTSVASDRIGISTSATAISGSVTFTNVSSSGVTTLDDAPFYVLTNERNVYKCLYNNNGAPSTVKPYSTTHQTIKTDDGYIWKFMYTIPNSLINKFMSVADMPVTTSIRQAYYSRGAINSVVVEAYGSGYSPGDYLVVDGDGYLIDNPLRILSTSVGEGGSGYTTAPTITISDPYDSFTYTTSTKYLNNQYVKYDNRIYEVTTGGISGTTPPTHTGVNIIANGETFLRFVGLTASGTAILTDTSVSSVDMSGIIGYITLDNAGSGYDYLNPPAVTITGNGSGATASANVSSEGYLLGVTITNRGTGYKTAAVSIAVPVSGVRAVASIEIYYGYGYSTAPIAVCSPPFTATASWSAGLGVSNNNIISQSGRFYRVTSSTSGQTLGTTAPSHLTGSVTNGTATLLFIGRTALVSTSLELTKAKLVPIIDNGQIVSAIVSDPGVGYTTATITAYSATGEGAVVVPNLSYGDLNTRQANIELLAMPGTIDVIPMLSSGSGYSYANIAISGDGTGCTATAVIELGRIVKINVVNPGSGYTKASVIITGNTNATQAYARPIISPPSGHGKNAVRELLAKSISMTTTIAKDVNQGFIVNNDYRQLGILKNPTGYGSTRRLTSFSASPCYNIVGDFVLANIETDMILTDANGFKYRVVAKPETSNGTVPLLIQSIDNTVPIAGQLMFYGTLGQATLTTVTPPTVNKYSGDVMFIDNRSSFQPTDEQTVSIKTAIRF